jgi:fructose transport system substrate-binding protein
LQAVVAAGKTKQITIVTIDGGCAVEPDVASGAIGADAMQFPGKMATLGVDAIVAYARHGTKPKASVDTGTALATASPVAGVTSHGIAWELQNCWG